MNTSVFISTFLAASIEVIEMVAIIVAVGVTRQWRGALAGTAAGLLVLAVLIAALGTALQGVPLTPIRLIVGALLLVFGLQWLRKGVLRVSRDGWATGIADQRVEEDVGDGFDWTGFVLAFRGVSLEGLEIAVIVVAFGAADHAIASATIGAVASVLLIGALGPEGRQYSCRRLVGEGWENRRHGLLLLVSRVQGSAWRACSESPRLGLERRRNAGVASRARGAAPSGCATKVRGDRSGAACGRGPVL